jgi:hypothetical protein
LAAVDLYGMAEEVGILGAEGLHQEPKDPDPQHCTGIKLPFLCRCWAAIDLYGMAEEVGIVGAEGLHQEEPSESKEEGRTEKWNEEEETKSAKSNKDIKVS